MMKLLIVSLCVLSTTAWGRERRIERLDRLERIDRLELKVTPVTPMTPLSRLTRLLAAPPPIASHAVLRLDDVLAKGQQQLVSVLESAQHLGSRYRTVWLTPSLGSVNGASLRIDFK